MEALDHFQNSSFAYKQANSLEEQVLQEQPMDYYGLMNK